MYLPSNVEKDFHLSFIFENDDYIELKLNELQDYPFNGWNIHPHQDPLVYRIL